MPSSCAELGKSCGWQDDGCGGQVLCGSCTQPEKCTESGRCEVCVPKTCAELPDACGNPSDGCFATLQCGSCAYGDACRNFECTPLPTTPGATQWQLIKSTPQSDWFSAIAPDQSGHVFALLSHAPVGALTASGPNATGLKVSPTGEHVGDLFNPSPYVDLHGAAESPLLFLSGTGPSYDVRSKASPNSVSSQFFSAESVRILAAGPDSAIAALVTEETHRELFVTAFSQYTLDESARPFRFEHAAFDSAMNLAVVGTVTGPFTWGGNAYGAAGAQRAAVFKFSRGGALEWGAQLPVSSRGYRVGISTAGTIAVLAEPDATFTFAGRVHEVTPPALAVLLYEPNGAPRTAVVINTAENQHNRLFAVDPAGAAYVLVTSSHETVYKVRFDGTVQWSRIVTSNGSNDYRLASVRAMAVAADGGLIVGGTFRGSHDFGASDVPWSGGYYDHPDFDAFLLKLRP